MKSRTFFFVPTSLLVVATNTLQVITYDIRQLQQPLYIRDTRLGYNLRSIHLLPQEKGTE